MYYLLSFHDFFFLLNFFRVCTVAGLCNSKRIDAMLDARTNQVQTFGIELNKV